MLYLVASFAHQLEIVPSVVGSIMVFVVYEELRILLVPFSAMRAVTILGAIQIIEKPLPILLGMAYTFVHTTRTNSSLPAAFGGSI